MKNHNYDYLGKEKAEALVSGYLHLDEYAHPVIPKFVNPDQLKQLLQEYVKFESDADVMWRAFDIVGFYGLMDCVDYFWSFLTLNSTVDRLGFSNACSIVNMAAYVGDEKQWKESHKYYEQILIKRVEAKKNIPLLIRCYTALGPDCTSESLRALCLEKQEKAKLEAGISDAGYIASQSINQIVNNDLPRAEKAMVKLKDIIMLSHKERLKEFIMLYLGLNPLYPEYLFRKSAYFLLRQAEKGEAEKQEIIAGLLGVLESEIKLETDPIRKKFHQVRLLKALEYFDFQKLPPDLSKFLFEAKAGGQDDFISVDQPNY